MGSSRVTFVKELINQATENNSNFNNENEQSPSLLDTLVPVITKVIAFAQKHKIWNFLSNSSESEIAGGNRGKPQISESMLQAMKRCKHPSHGNLMNNVLIQEMPVRHFKTLIECDWEKWELLNGELSKANFEINAIFVRRLMDIDHRAGNDLELKLLTFQEWVDTLLKLNQSFIKNMRDLEKKMNGHARKLAKEIVQKNNEIENYRSDINSLINFIRFAFYNKDWTTTGLDLKTIRREDIFGDRT